MGRRGMDNPHLICEVPFCDDAVEYVYRFRLEGIKIYGREVLVDMALCEYHCDNFFLQVPKSEEG